MVDERELRDYLKSHIVSIDRESGQLLVAVTRPDGKMVWDDLLEVMKGGSHD